jgi:hypothetical protein
MSWMNRQKEDKTDKMQERAVEAVDMELEQALKNFRLSVHASSDAAWSRTRPRTAAEGLRRRGWRLAVGWALGCVLAAGSVSGGLFERQHQQELRQVEARQRAAEQQKHIQEQQAQAQVSDEALLAGVDSDISRQVPSALEPLAQMMADDETK